MGTLLRIIVATAIAMSAVVRLPHRPAAVSARTEGIAAAGATSGQANAGAQGIVPEGEKVEVPDSDGCFIYVTAWENGSWVDPNSPPGRRRLQQGKSIDTRDSKNDVAEVKRWLEHLLAQSPDMRAKSKAACEASGVKFIQVAIVRDDPKAGVGTAFIKTPVIVVDMGDSEKIGKSAQTSGTRNPSLANSARMTLTSYLPVTVIVHEIEHMKRKRKEFHHEVEEGLALADENKVAAELENFRPHTTDGGGRVPKLERTSYSPIIYTYRPFRDMSIDVRLDVAGAGLVFEQREEGQGPRFADLSDDDDRALGGISSSQTVEEFDPDFDGIGTVHDNCPHAWNPQQHDRNDDSTGDDCDPEITQGHELTDALVGFVIATMAHSATGAGGPPQLALIGPDIAGGIQFVRLAEVWPIADPFGVFRSPGVGDRYLDRWIRTAASVRLAALRLFLEPFGVPSSAIVGPGLRDSYGSAATDPWVQAFAARVGTFSPGSPLGETIIIPVWVEPAPLAGATRMPLATDRAPKPIRSFDLYGAFRLAGPGPWIASRGQGAPRRPFPSNETPRPSLKVFFVSLGQTTGSAFKMTVVNDGNVPVWLMLNTFALKPLANVTAADVERQVKPFEGRGRVTMNVDGYCLDLPKRPPPPGMVFGLADESLQGAMAPIDRITHAVVRLRELGRLKPDTEDATEYAHDMVQWSIWTLREGFDEPHFTRAFVDHVRKNFAAAGDKWTREMERAVAVLAPARWQVIQTVLRESAVSPH